MSDYISGSNSLYYRGALAEENERASILHQRHFRSKYLPGVCKVIG